MIADSRLGSVKTVIALKEFDFYSVKLVKKAHEQFPQESLDSLYFTVGKKKLSPRAVMYFK